MNFPETVQLIEREKILARKQNPNLHSYELTLITDFSVRHFIFLGRDFCPGRAACFQNMFLLLFPMENFDRCHRNELMELNVPNAGVS